MELAEVKAMRKALGDVTINDIVVAIVGGALRKYLLSKDELPADSLIAGAPVNVRSERNSESSGNQVSLMRISMATDIADPVERLQAIHDSAQQSKAFSNALGSSVMMDISEILIPQVLGWGFRAVTLAAARTARPMPCHVVISNVPGPQFPLYLAGARVHLMIGTGTAAGYDGAVSRGPEWRRTHHDHLHLLPRNDAGPGVLQGVSTGGL